MPTNCAVAFCKNTHKGSVDIGFFSFPKGPDIRRIWVQRCQREDSFNLATSRVCSDHFTPEDFERNLMAESGLSRQRRTLKKDAVPSLRLFPNKCPSPGTKKTGKRALMQKCRERKKNAKMPGVRCCALDCGNYFLKTKRKQLNIAYHRFPKDPCLREIWALMCQPANCQRLESCFVCSEHFTDSDYDSELKDRMLGVQGRRRLKKDAFPRKKLNLADTNDSELKELITNLHQEDTVTDISLEDEQITSEDSVSPVKKPPRKRKLHSEVNSLSLSEEENEIRQKSVVNNEERDPLMKKIMRSSCLSESNVSPMAMSILLRNPIMGSFNKKIAELPVTFPTGISYSHMPGPSGTIKPCKVPASPTHSLENVEGCRSSAGMISDFVARIDSIIEKVEGLDPKNDRTEKDHPPASQPVVTMNQSFFKAEVVSRIDSILEKVSSFNNKDAVTRERKQRYKRALLRMKFTDSDTSDEELTSPETKLSGQSIRSRINQGKDSGPECSAEKNDPLYLPINEFIGGCFQKVTVEVDPDDVCFQAKMETDPEIIDLSAGSPDLSDRPLSPSSVVPPTPAIARRQKLYHFITNELKIVQTVKLSKLLSDIYSEFKPKLDIQMFEDELSNLCSK